MGDKKPHLYLTWDRTGMFLWFGSRKPMRPRESGVYEARDAARIRLPVSWFGGLVEENQCREFDVEAVFAAQ